jgi:hypothetical protein
MRVLYASLFFFCLSVLPLSAQSLYTVEQKLSLPPSYYVGDVVELRLTLSLSSDTAIQAPRDLPEAEWGEIRDIRVFSTENGAEIRITFVPFLSGEQKLPPLKLGTIILENITINTNSLVAEEDSELKPPRVQLLLPGTGIYAGLFAALIFIVPALGIIFFRWGKAQIVAIINRHRENQPKRRILRELKRLSEAAAEMKARDFYIELLDEIRNYLSKRFNIDYTVITTKELESRLSLIEEKSRQKSLITIFRYGDRVKFGGDDASLAARRGHIDRIYQLVAYIEERREANVDN